MIKFLIFALFTFQTFAGLVGEVKDTNIYSGHISLDEQDPFYKGYKVATSELSGITTKTPSQIVKSYFEFGVLSSAKINVLISETEAHLSNIKKNFCIDKFRKKIDSYDSCNHNFYGTKKFIKKWKKFKLNLALKFVISNLTELKQVASSITMANVNSMESLKHLSKLFTSLEIIQGIRGEDYQRGRKSGLVQTYAQVKNILSKDQISKNAKHPSNLLKLNDKQMFYSYKELEQLKANGEDISLLEPPSSGIWRKPKSSISTYNTTNYNNDGKIHLEKVFKKNFLEKFLDPAKSIDIEYRGDKLSGGQTVKFNVYIKDVKFKLKFITDKNQSRETFNEGAVLKRHIQGSEANVEPVANTLAAAIGYTIDPTYFKKEVRLYISEEAFGKESFEKERIKLIKKLEERYTVTSNPESALNDVREDKSGRKYILIKSVSLEQKSNKKTDMNIGFFQRSGMGKSLKREHRALYTFLALIMDIDLKDDNTKVKLVPYTTEANEESFKVMLSNSDMGSALGTGYPNLYNFNLVKSLTKNNININYIRLFSLKNRFAANIDDAKWVTRRIAQLSLDQIVNAFEFGGFPKLVARYYALLFAKKRNQLVKALGLLGETFKDDSEKLFTIELLEEFNGSIKGYEEFFLNGFLTDPDNKLQDSSLENFPRFWGTSYTNLNSGDPQTRLIKDLKTILKIRAKKIINQSLLSQVTLSNAGIGFLNNGIFENNIVNFCDKRCFISAVSVGVNSFIPFRFIVNNPDTNSPKPFVILDVLRFGAYVGNSNDLLDNNLANELKDSFTFQNGVKAFALKEYIKIKEVDSIDDFFIDRPTIISSKTETFKSLERKILDLNMKDSFYQREYLGVAGALTARPLNYVPFSSLRFRTRVVGIKSNLVKKTKTNYILRYGNIKSFDFDLTYNLIDFIFRYPVLRYANTTNRFSEQVLKFDINTKSKTLLNCLKARTNCEDKLVQNKNTKVTTGQSILDLFRLFGQSRTKVKGYEHFMDLVTKEINIERYYIFRTNTFKMRQLLSIQEGLQSTAHMDKDNNINIAVELNHFRPAAEKKHLELFLNEYKEILPDDIHSYDTTYTKKYLGDLTATVKVNFNQDALKILFDDNFLENKFCAEYASFSKIKYEENCLKSGSSKYSLFLRRYRKAKKSYDNLVASNIEHARYKHLKSLAKFFYDKKFKSSVLKFMTRIVDSKDFKRDVEITSTLSSFAGDNDTIKESNFYKGKGVPFRLSKSNMLGDDIIKMLTPFVYSNINFKEI